MNANLSRRSFLKHTAAGSAVALPVSAVAAPNRVEVDPPHLSDEEQLDACIADLKKILRRMYPDVTEIAHSHWGRTDGTFVFTLHPDRRWVSWTGPGLYRLSLNGYASVYWLEKVMLRDSRGQVFGQEFHGWCWLGDERRFVDDPRSFWEGIGLIEKLEGPEWRQARP